jgi:hypothetical protein
MLQLNFVMKIGNIEFKSDNEVDELKTIKTELEVKTNNIRRVTAIKNVIIPARCEIVITGKIENNNKGDSKMLLVETGNTLKNVLVARTLVDNESDVVPIKTVNFSNQPIELLKGELLGIAVECEEVLTDKVNDEHITVSDKLLSKDLEQLYNESIKEQTLSNSTKIELLKLLTKHQNVFAENKFDLGEAEILHDIDTGNSKPIRASPRRIPIKLQTEVDRQIEEMLQKGIVSKGNRGWSSPVQLVKKKDGTYRFCVDYRKLNSLTKTDAYPLPRTDDILNKLNGAKWFCKIDLLSSYWQVGMTDRAKERSAFCVKGGLYEWNRMPFGLCNSPSTFERLIENVLLGLNWISCLCYMDDIILFAETELELLCRLDDVLTRLGEANLKAKPVKCSLFRREVDFLGHAVSEEGIGMDPARVSAVKEWKQPTNINEVRSFLGTAGYYRKFVKDFAKIAAPLFNLTCKTIKFEWSQACEKSFNSLKEALIINPVLKYPDMTKPFILDCDASNSGLGSVLSQIDENNMERVIAYASRSLTKCELNYCVTRKELLCVVWSVEHFRHYLFGCKFKVRTDHSSLKWLMEFKEPRDQVARWIETLSNYVFEVVHRPGRAHGNADGLSRQCNQCKRTGCIGHTHVMLDEENVQVRASDANGKVKVNSITFENKWSNEDLSKFQDNDNEINYVKTAFKIGIRPANKELNLSKILC